MRRLDDIRTRVTKEFFDMTAGMTEGIIDVPVSTFGELIEMAGVDHSSESFPSNEDCDALEIFEEELLRKVTADLEQKTGRKRTRYTYKSAEWSLLDSREELMALPQNENDSVVSCCTIGRMDLLCALEG